MSQPLPPGNSERSAKDHPELFVLIVEDDEVFRQVIAEHLEKAGYLTRQAANGLIGKTIFDLNRERISVIVSDIRMPAMDGIALLKYVRAASDVPFIIMTGFSEILETHSAHELGANEFILKPFRANALLDAVTECLHPSPKPEVAPAKTEQPVAKRSFCKIHIDEFISSSNLISDIFIKLSGDKFVKVARAGDLIPVERLSTYKDKHVEYLYVAAEDFKSYVDFNRKVASAVAKTAISSEKKVHLFKVTSAAIVHEAFVDGIDQEIVKAAQDSVEQTLELVSEDEEILEAFFQLDTHADRVYANSVACAILSCMVAKRHGWNAASTLFRLTLGGLLQDIGLKDIDLAIVKKRRIARTSQEAQLYDAHPIRSRSAILELRGIPEDVAQIVLQHHENLAETGFPNRPKRETIHALARILLTVNVFVELVSPLEEGIPPLKPRAALERMYRLHRDELDMTFMRRLMEIFAFDPTKGIA